MLGRQPTLLTRESKDEALSRPGIGLCTQDKTRKVLEVCVSVVLEMWSRPENVRVRMD